VKAPTISPIYILARTFVLLLGLTAVTWGGFVLPIFKRQTALNHVATELFKGRDFKLETLTTERQKVSTGTSQICNPTELRNAVVVNRAILVDSIPLGQTATDSTAELLENSARSAVACEPSDSFVWLTLFWLDAAKHGFTPQNSRYLELSYANGPNEGWIAYWRLQVALAYFDRLPRELSDSVVADFVKLLDTQILYNEAAAIFAASPVAAQSRIVDALKDATENSQLMFAKVLAREGINVSIPNAELPDSRPWER
jgi:hypothetical protein